MASVSKESKKLYYVYVSYIGQITGKVCGFEFIRNAVGTEYTEGLFVDGAVSEEDAIRRVREFRPQYKENDYKLVVREMKATGLEGLFVWQ